MLTSKVTQSILYSADLRPHESNPSVPSYPASPTPDSFTPHLSLEIPAALPATSSENPPPEMESEDVSTGADVLPLHFPLAPISLPLWQQIPPLPICDSEGAINPCSLLRFVDEYLWYHPLTPAGRDFAFRMMQTDRFTANLLRPLLEFIHENTQAADLDSSLYPMLTPREELVQWLLSRSSIQREYSHLHMLALFKRLSLFARDLRIERNQSAHTALCVVGDLIQHELHHSQQGPFQAVLSRVRDLVIGLCAMHQTHIAAHKAWAEKRGGSYNDMPVATSSAALDREGTAFSLLPSQISTVISTQSPTSEGDYPSTHTSLASPSTPTSGFDLSLDRRFVNLHFTPMSMPMPMSMPSCKLPSMSRDHEETAGDDLDIPALLQEAQISSNLTLMSVFSSPLHAPSERRLQSPPL